MHEDEEDEETMDIADDELESEPEKISKKVSSKCEKSRLSEVSI